MSAAFQADAFQNDAFQIEIGAPVVPAGQAFGLTPSRVRQIRVVLEASGRGEASIRISKRRARVLQTTARLAARRPVFGWQRYRDILVQTGTWHAEARGRGRDHLILGRRRHLDIEGHERGTERLALGGLRGTTFRSSGHSGSRLVAAQVREVHHVVEGSAHASGHWRRVRSVRVEAGATSAGRAHLRRLAFSEDELVLALLGGIDDG